MDELDPDDLWLEFEVVEALEAAPRLSPAARRFMAGEMGPGEARRLGFVPPDGVPPDALPW